MSNLINRRVTVEHFQRIKDEHETHGKRNDCCEKYNNGFIAGVDYCISFISLLPSAEPKHGKWIRGTEKSLWDETDDGPVYTDATTWTCSECGYKRFMTSCPDDKFCKECGADMRTDG